MNEVLRFSVGNETKKEKQNLVGKYVLVTPAHFLTRPAWENKHRINFDEWEE